MTCMTSTTCILSYTFHTTYTAIITSQILQIPRFTFHSEKGTERRDLPRLVAQAESYPANSSDSCCMLLLGSYGDGEPFGVCALFVKLSSYSDFQLYNCTSQGDVWLPNRAWKIEHGRVQAVQGWWVKDGQTHWRRSIGRTAGRWLSTW